ncbi:MAG: hypothetical protein R6V44_01920 [Paracoccaceae bacterium]
MARIFDLVVMTDWSARSSLSPARETADSIWIGADGVGGPEPPRYFRGRAAAIGWLADRLATEAAAGRRVLAGFDFPFGWPRGAAARVAGRAEGLAVWAWLAREIEDAPDNRNDRWRVAERLNACWDGVGPFWGRPAAAPHPGVPTKGRARHGAHPPERRHVEVRIARAQPVWKLFTTGSVGSQTLLGLPALERLRRAPGLAGRVAVWPFETGWAAGAAPVVLAEIYPSMLDGAVRAVRRPDEILDRAQVRALASAYAALDAAGGLAPLFGPPPGLDPAALAEAEREEAWILGLEGREALSAALAGR